MVKSKETYEGQQDYSQELQKIPTTNSIRPVIVNRGRILLYQEHSGWATQFNPDKWMLPNILIDDPKPFTSDELSSIVRNHCGVRVEVNGRINIEESSSPTHFDRGTSVLGSRVISFKGKVVHGGVYVDPRRYQKFRWVGKKEVGTIPIDEISMEILAKILESTNHD